MVTKRWDKTPPKIAPSPLLKILVIFSLTKSQVIKILFPSLYCSSTCFSSSSAPGLWLRSGGGGGGGYVHAFPPTGLLEERALLLGRMGKHEQALFIYVHILKDTKMAEEYVDPALPPPSGPESRPAGVRRGVRD